MMNLLDRVFQEDARRLDERRTRKALRRVLPNVEWIYTKVIGQRDVRLLESAGWEVVTVSSGDLLDKIAGTQTTARVVLRKRNPRLA